MWQIFAKAAISAFDSYQQASLQNQYARIDNAAAKATATNQNTVRTANNALSAAQGDAARYLQSVQTRATLEAGGEALEAEAINMRRNDDALLSQGFEASIAASEQQGQQLASVAAAGGAGSVVDDINAASALRYARAARAAKEQRDTAAYDSAHRAALIADQAISNTDVSAQLTGLDYNTNVAQLKTIQNPWGVAAVAAGSSIAGNQATWASPQSSPASTPSSTTAGSGFSFKATESFRGSNSTGTVTQSQSPFSVGANYSLGKL